MERNDDIMVLPADRPRPKRVKVGDWVQATTKGFEKLGGVVVAVRNGPPGTTTNVEINRPELGSGGKRWRIGHLGFKKLSRKANDNIPADEMLLAEALSEAKGRGLKWTAGAPFDTGTAIPEQPRECCAIGALALRAGKVGQDSYEVVERLFAKTGLATFKTHHVFNGNDCQGYDEDDGITDAERPGMTLGRAFRHAMKD